MNNPNQNNNLKPTINSNVNANVLANKTVIITGASRGIGAACARYFAKSGYNLSLCCQNSMDKLEILAKELCDTYSIKVMTFQGNVGDFNFAKEMVEKTLSELKSIDILINNAGISHIGLLQDMTIEEWNNIISTNLTSVFSFCKMVIPKMITKQSGKIINISSVWGNVGASCEVAYSATKGGVNSLTKALGKELAPSNIQVNAISCGVIDTEMNHCFSEEERQELMDEIPAGRFAQPEEVAELALALANGNSYLSGQIITLDGGWI